MVFPRKEWKATQTLRKGRKCCGSSDTSSKSRIERGDPKCGPEYRQQITSGTLVSRSTSREALCGGRVPTFSRFNRMVLFGGTHQMMLQFIPVERLRQELVSSTLDHFHPILQHLIIKLSDKDDFGMRSFDLDLSKRSKVLVERLAQLEDNDIHLLLHHRSVHCLFGLAWDNNRLILAESILDAPRGDGVVWVQNRDHNHVFHRLPSKMINSCQALCTSQSLLYTNYGAG